MKIIIKLRSVALTLTALLIGILCLSTNAYATEERTVVESDTISCVNNTDTVKWTLYSDGEMVFSGSGTLAINLEDGWYRTWGMYFDASRITSVSVEEGSNIVVNTADLMFSRFTNCKSIDLTGMDFSQTTGMIQMFYECNSLESLDLSNMKTDNVTNMRRMFGGCSKLTSLDVSGFNTSKVTDMSYLFYNCTGLTELNFSGLDTGNATDISNMFEGVQLTSIDVSGFDTSKVTDMSYMFKDCNNVTGLDVSGFVTANVTNMKGMFENCRSVTQLDVSGFHTDKVTDMASMFSGCSSLNTLEVGNFITDYVTDMAFMFYGCNGLTTLDVSKFNTSNVTDMSAMFYQCKSLTDLDVKNFVTTKVTNMLSMFNGCRSLKVLDVSRFDTSNVSDMKNMFINCSTLTELNVSGFDTANVTDMTNMFSECSHLTQLDVSKFNTSKVTTMSGMFNGCVALQVLNVSDFDTGLVTSMSNMFQKCQSLTQLDVSKFDTANVTNMYHMFSGCNSLDTLDVSGFNTANVKDMADMFSDCRAVVELNLSSFNTANVTSMANMFYNCNALKTLDLSSFDTSKVTGNKLKIKGSNLERFISPKTASDFIIETDEKFFYYDTTDGGRNIYYDKKQTFTDCAPLTTFYFIPTAFPITYVYKGELVDCVSTYSVKDGLASLGYAVLEHYDFDGWYTDETYKTKLTSIPGGTIGNLTLYAKQNPETYNITYKNTEPAVSTNSLPPSHTYGIEQTIPDLESTCYAFAGWHTDEELTKRVETISATTVGDIILYAKWTPVHEIDIRNAKEATCQESGYSGDVYCLTCEKTILTGKPLPITDHDRSVVKSAVEPTCTTDGYSGDVHCKWCDLLITKGESLTSKGHDIDKTNGTVITPATAVSEGIIQYKCKNCDYTETETIEKIGKDFVDEYEIPEYVLAVNDDTIFGMLNDNDIEGSSFALLQARAVKTTKSSITLKWNKIKHADGYKIYGNLCGKGKKYKYIKTITNGDATKFTHKKRKKGTYYKYIVRAYKLIDGQEVTIAVSKTIHASTAGGKYGNAKAVKIKTDKNLKKKAGKYTLTINKNKRYTVKASEIKHTKKNNIHRRISFESSDTNIVTVKKGVVKGIRKGTCYIYAYAQNGVYAKIKVTVK